MIAEREITSIVLTTDEERKLIETIFEMARTVRPGYTNEDNELLKTVGYIAKDLKEYDEAKAIDY